jgi:hypothetical protein
VATQFNMTVPNESSFPSDGRAIITVEAIKGKINDAIVATRSTTPLLAPLPLGSAIIGQFSLFTDNSSSPGRQSLGNRFLLNSLIESHGNKVAKYETTVALVEISL